MATVKPFRALRPLPARAAEVSAVPYDVVSTAEARALAEGNPLSFLRVSRPEIELPEGTDPYAAEVYQRAALNFDRLISTAPLVIEDDASLYLYRLRMGDHAQTGLVACCPVDEYDDNTILKHELTRRDKENDRTRHILTLRAQTGPVFLIYRATAEINALMTQVVQHEPLFDFTAPDGVEHIIWRVPAELNQPFIDKFGAVPKFYIADGHHRAKSASRARAELRAQSPGDRGDEEYNFFQCVIFPDDQVRILPYNRVVKDLNRHTPEEFLKELRVSFDITENADPSPSEHGHYAMYLEGRWYGLKLHGETTRPLSVIDRLDVSILQNKVLAPILGIEDPRTDKRIDFVGGIRGTAELERLVSEGRAAVAFSLHPTTLDDLMAVADAGEVMPPKSTWFEPKLRDGLLSHLI
ncbi:MAG TPA: DUF1015 family protein [Blastocatellia bacterium]|nr:DUF1015 family protein [Blastocatellia bacterium]